MSICLGIYVEKEIIKYAKLKKENDDIKILNFNIEFYEDLEKSIKKIIYETNSSKIPISINISGVVYDYFNVDSNLKIKELKKSIKYEFQKICFKENREYNLLKAKHILRKESENKLFVLNISTLKSEIKRIKDVLKFQKINSITPISTSIINLLKIEKDENIVVVNIENKTEITIIINGQIYKIYSLSDGMEEIRKEIYEIDKDNKKVNAIIKDLTIYTQNIKKAKKNENEYIKLITPILYKIVMKTKDIIDKQKVNINKVYITGSATNINNIDLFFQEYLLNINCEILKPFFLETSSIKTSIKEYIEVNSAISLSMNGLGYLQKDFNFYNKSNKKSFSQNENGKKIKKNNSNKRLSSIEKLMLRICAVFIIFMIGLIGFSNISYDILEERKNLVSEAFKELENQKDLMNEDLNKITNKTEEYKRVIENIKSLTEVENQTEKNRIISKFGIPDLLNRIMSYIPKEVKILSIKNEENSKKIFIEAQAEKYEQLGYFSSALKNENVLKNIKSTSGSKEGNVIKVTIEGELP